jgi:mannobiose 2-epimerase
MDLKVLKSEIFEHLNNKIIPFWEELKDENNGGYISYVGFDLKPDPYAPKGLVLTSRILWFFSSLYNQLRKEEFINFADHSYKFLIKSFLDKENKGFYWMVDYKGEPIDKRKHLYGQAFVLYGLSEYYKATQKKESLDLALEIYKIIEEVCKNDVGYKEEFDEKWNPKENIIVSEYGIIYEKSMNTLLHILEAYTNLFTATYDQSIKKKIEDLIILFKEKIYDSKTNHLYVFFDKKMNPIIDAISYGHDIEATWLIDEALRYIDNNKLIKEMSEINLKIAEKVLEEAFESGSLLNERVKGIVDKNRIWWVQAEALVGFLNTYQKSKLDKFLKAVFELWEFIKDFLVDKRAQGEWFWKLDENYIPSPMPEVDLWKCPYHNGRMCLEVIKRI